MKSSMNIEDILNRLPKGYDFTYTDLISNVDQKDAVIKALNRMAASGKIEKLSRGKYYKPKVTEFGKLPPDQYQVAKDLLEKTGKTIGYMTGYSIYNKLGLSTQVSNTIQIACNDFRPPLTRGIYKILFVKQKNTITKDNIPLLQILDAMKFINKIPDTSNEQSCKIFIEIIRALADKELKSIVRLSAKYPPSTRALLGAILEFTDNSAFSKKLKLSLNPITTYDIKGIKELLPTATEWGIK